MEPYINWLSNYLNLLFNGFFRLHILHMNYKIDSLSSCRWKAAIVGNLRSLLILIIRWIISRNTFIGFVSSSYISVEFKKKGIKSFFFAWLNNLIIINRGSCDSTFFGRILFFISNQIWKLSAQYWTKIRNFL